MKEAEKRTQITDQICRQAQLMRKAGANQTEIGKLLGINPCTVSRMEAAGFDLKVYQENRTARREKEKKQAEEPAKAAEEQVPGQMEMDLTPAKPEMSDQTKMMRFLAGRLDRLEEKLTDCSVMVDMKTIQLAESIDTDIVILTQKIDKLNDTLSMILRAVRKE